MPAASGPGFSRGGPRVFPNGFRTGRTATAPVPTTRPTDPWLMELETYTTRVGQLRALHASTGFLCAGNRQAGRVRTHFPF